MRHIVRLLGVTAALVLTTGVAQAATLGLSPAKGTYTVGRTFTVNVMVGSSDQAINAVSGVILFPKEKLRATGVVKSGSIMSLWVQEPKISQAAGTIRFEGVILNPGFKGVGGKVIGVSFKALEAGSATVGFSEGLALANDGEGTNILKGWAEGHFTLKASAATAAPPSALFAAPKIISSTHPDPGKWSRDFNPKFSWLLPEGASGVSFVFDEKPDTVPPAESEGILRTKNYNRVQDGVWYFHLRILTTEGWSAPAHYRVKMDTQSPHAFELEFPHGKRTTDPRPVVLFNTTDDLSGVSHYLVKIGEGDVVQVRTEVASNPFTLPAQAPGKHTIVVQAVDYAGNETTAIDEFVIDPLTPPTLTAPPKEFTEGDLIEVRGHTYPGVTVIVTIRNEQGETTTQEMISDTTGNFSVIWSRRLLSGVYTVWAQVRDLNGAMSGPSPSHTFDIKKPTFERVGSSLVRYLSIAVGIISLLLLLLLVLWYIWRRLNQWRREMHDRVHTTRSNLHKSFGALRDDLRNHISLLEQAREQRSLTSEEIKILKSLQRHLTKIEIELDRQLGRIER